ncbi:MAG: hypothetical protein JKY48_06345 [Flavobacteriales bacterium]|nr:hypothetical protein [Flavobacteriales bacterium]
MNLVFVKTNWDELTNKLPNIKSDFYNQLIKLYLSSDRYYHNLIHIESLLLLTKQYEHLLNSPKTIQFAIWYHDSIYNSSKNNNEEQSAELAKLQLAKMDVSQNLISDCYDLIIATKTHQLSKKLNSFDAQFMLDIDLSILAATKENYIEYSKQIREEYKICSEEHYNKGRKSVLQYFLNSERIYKTDLFYNLNEKRARINLALELQNLL